MRLVKLLVFFLAFSGITASGSSFVKTFTDASAGSYLRIVATPDGGWAVFFIDNFRLYKFDACGNLAWSREYAVPATTWTSNDFLSLPGGGFAFMTRIDNGLRDVALVVRLDASGQVQWSNTYGDSDFDRYPYTLSHDASGNILLFENMSHHTNSPSFMVITKIGPGGNILWSRQYDPRYTWGGALATSDNGMLARTGNYFVKVDASGNVQWTSSCYIPGTYEYYSPVEVADGYIFTTVNSPGGQVNFHKFDKQGNLAWAQYKHTNMPGRPPLMRKHPNGNFVAVFSTGWVEFDKDLTAIHQGSLDGSLGLWSRDICFLAGGIPVLAAVGNSGFGIARMEINYSAPCTLPLPVPVITQVTMTWNSQSTSSVSQTLTVTPWPMPFATVSLSPPATCRFPLALDLGPDTAICGSTTLVLQDITGSVFDRYQWSTGDTTPSISISVPGTYSLLVTNDCGEDSLFDMITVAMFPVADAGLGPDVFLCKDSTTEIHAPACDSCLFSWNTGATTSSLVISDTGMYSITVETPSGCLSGDTILILQALCECTYYLPSAFTPNSDGRNDSFLPAFQCEMEDYILEIYDRWGRRLFSTGDPALAWDGMDIDKPVATGVYPYRLQYTPLLEGRRDFTVLKTGTVTVIY